MMRLLAKVGFAQSYTYFTWRNHKHDLTEYVSELTCGEMKEYFTGNFFANTPDILPPILQYGGRPAFIMRAVLAATLSSRLRHLQWLRAVRERSDSRQGGIPRLGEVRDQDARLESARATSSTSSPASTRFAMIRRPCTLTTTCSSSLPTTPISWPMPR
jgi:hypothetical protein